jgi:hypothetical protein
MIKIYHFNMALTSASVVCDIVSNKKELPFAMYHKLNL